jgi:hypothetical protein
MDEKGYGLCSHIKIRHIKINHRPTVATRQFTHQQQQKDNSYISSSSKIIHTSKRAAR